MFLVIDKNIFVEIAAPTHIKGLVVLLGSYFAFNLSVDQGQKLLFNYLEEFVLGIYQNKKNLIDYSVIFKLGY